SRAYTTNFSSERDHRKTAAHDLQNSGANVPPRHHTSVRFSPLGRVALTLLLDALDCRLDADQMRVDGERRLEGLERPLVAVEREIDLSQTGERAEMMRLELQRA